MKKKIINVMLCIVAMLLLVCIQQDAHAVESKHTHTWNLTKLEFTWSDDFSECRAIVPCTECDAQLEIPNVSYAVYHEPTCTNYGGYICYEIATYTDVSGTQTFKSSKPYLTEQALGHNWQNVKNLLEPTCTEQGIGLYRCARCGELDEKIIPASGHSYTRTKVLSTCKELGYYRCICIRCGDQTTDTDVTATLAPHSYIKTEVIQPTCKQGGYTIYTCSVCDVEVMRDYTNKTNEHQYKEERKEPDCTNDGAVYQVCTVCDKKEKMEDLPAGHQMVETQKASTCTEAGYTLHKCKNCNFNYKDTYLPLSDHSYKEVRENASCLEAGTTYKQCSNCGKQMNRSVLPALGHEWNNGVVTKAATCKDKGVKTFTCARCKQTKTEDIKIDSTNHSGGTKIRNRKAATCGKAGFSGDTYCESCGAKVTTGKLIPATGNHKWDSGKVTKQPTFTATGVKTFTCSVCKKTKTETIAKLAKTALNKATVTLSKTSVTYTGKAQKPAVTVKVGSVTVPSNQYTVTYSANTNAGTGKIVIKATAKATYVSGSVTKTFKITKANNPMTVSPASKSFTVTACKKKAQSVTIKASKAQGTVSYKSSNTKYVTVSSKGKVTIKKGTPAGTYKITVTAKGNGNYNSASKTVTITVK